MRGWTGCPMSWQNVRPPDRKQEAADWLHQLNSPCANWWREGAFQRTVSVLLSYKCFCRSKWCHGLWAHFDFPSALLFFLQMFVVFFNLHVLTQNSVTGCYGRGGAGFMTGEVYLWVGGGWWLIPRSRPWRPRHSLMMWRSSWWCNKVVFFPANIFTPT